MSTATELWQARTVSNLRKDQIIRAELDAARAEVEKMAAEIAELTEELTAAQAHASDRDDLADEVERWIEERATLTTERDVLAAELADRIAWGEEGWRQALRNRDIADAYRAALDWARNRLQERRAETERARDMAVRSHVFDGGIEMWRAWKRDELDSRDEQIAILTAELDLLTEERDRALYDRDSARAQVSSNGR